MEQNIILFIIIVLLFIGLICIPIIKYLLIPFFFTPKLAQSETFKFLENKECVFVDYRTMTKIEKKKNIFKYKKGINFENMLSERSEYAIIGLSKPDNKYKLFWLELKQWHYFYPKYLYEVLIGKDNLQPRELNYIEETDQGILANLQTIYKQNVIVLTDKCPACNNKILPKESICSDCGLNLLG